LTRPLECSGLKMYLAGVLVVVVLLTTAFGLVRGWAVSNKPAPAPSDVQQARLSEEITIAAAGRGNPWISLSDGHDVITTYAGPEDLVRVLEQNQARPLSLASADFDEDGVPDLICGYAGPNGGIVTLLRGNVDSIYANTTEAQRRR